MGISSAAAIFQNITDMVIGGLEMTAVYLNDMIITGRDDAHHMANIRNLFDRLHDFGLRIKLFGQDKVEYLEYIIDRKGCRPSMRKIGALFKMPDPQNASQLCSFLGMVAPLNRLLAKTSTGSGQTSSAKRCSASRTR
jgi:hypothetical protein